MPCLVPTEQPRVENLWESKPRCRLARAQILPRRRQRHRLCSAIQQFASLQQVSDSNEKVSTLQSLLQVQSRAATMMLVREDPGVLNLPPAFVMQRLVDLKEARPSEDPADLIFMEPDLLSVHPSEEAYDTAKGRAVHAIRVFRGTHRDAIYLTKEVQSLRIPCERRISDLIKYVPLFYRTQRPVLRMGAADRLGIARLRNLLLDFHSACHELKRDQQAAALLQTAMRQQGLQGPLTRVSLLQLEADDLRLALSRVLIPPGRKTKVHMVDALCARLELS